MSLSCQSEYSRFYPQLRLWDTKIKFVQLCGVTSCTHEHYEDSCHFAILEAFMVATNFLTSNVFSTVRCRECSVIASESAVSVVVPEIAE